jgi:DNA-binding PadR family transcriptional regulator
VSIPHALLGLLARRAMHGYDLKVAFEAEVASLWTLNFGQLYPALEKLEQEGFVAKERIVQEDRPDKKVYSVTPAGRAELKRWLSEPGAPPKLSREGFSFKLIAVRAMPPGEFERLIAQQRQSYLQAIGEWTRGKQSLDPKREPVAVLLAQSAIFRLEADLKWLEYVLTMADGMKGGDDDANL